MDAIGTQSWEEVAAQNAGVEDNSRTRVMFSLEPKLDEKASATAGRPVFVDVEYIEKINPGIRLNIVKRPIEDRDRRDFAPQYKAWKSGLADPTTGTPLREWPQISRSQVETLAPHGVRSVEDLAELADSTCQSLGPGTLALKQKAKDWLEKAAGGALESKLRAENDAMRTQLEAMQKNYEDLAARVEEQAPSKGPGRPRKEKETAS